MTNVSKKIIVAQFCFTIHPTMGGVPKAVQSLISTFMTHEIISELVTLGNFYKYKKYFDKFRADLEKNNIRTFFTFTPINNKYGLGGISQLIKYWYKKDKPDFVILHQVFSLSTIFGFFYARKYSIPYFLIPHGSLMTESLNKNFFIKKVVMNLFYRKILINCKNIVVATKVELNDLDSEFKSVSRIIPLEFIPPDTKNIVQTQSTNFEWNVSDFIIFIGRFDKIKNLNILIESIDLIKIHLPKIRLVVAGNGSSSEKKKLIKLVESLSLQEYIEFKGWLEESEWLYLLSKARMIVVPSKAESFSLVASAAICLGIPCLTSNKVGVSDFIRQYRAGEVLNSITAENISQLALKILETEPGNYYNNASREFINIYSGENVIRSWREIFQI